jgi:Na+/citrate or Na+/malate symporter
MTVPRYQNLINLFFMFLFLVLYTIAVNTPNLRGEIDFVEGFLFAFVFGFFFDEVTKMC